MTPPLRELMGDAYHVQALADHEIYQVIYRLWVVVKARCRGGHDPPCLRNRRHVLYMYQAIGHLSFEDYEPLPLFQSYVRYPVEQVRPRPVSYVTQG